MVRLGLVFTMFIIECIHGQLQLPPLPMKAGCYLVSPEVEIFRVEGEAVIISFPVFKRVLKVHNIAPETATYGITKDNGTDFMTHQGKGRIHQNDGQLWLLPAQVSDSGEYISIYRNKTYCATGSIKLHVYKSNSADMKKLSYPISTMVGAKLTLRCPSISNFNKTGRIIHWYKDSANLQLGREDRGKLMIPAVKPSHAGVYTCQLLVLINSQQYNVSRAIYLHVEELSTTTSTQPDVGLTSKPDITSSRMGHVPIIPPPVITSPLNGTIFECLHGSELELYCKVLTTCQSADATEVTWLINGQSVTTSYFNGQAVQERRVSRVPGGCQIELTLILVTMTEDARTELKCVAQNQGGRQDVVTQLQLEDSTFTWIVVVAVAVSCFLTVVSVFLYVLFKPKQKKKMDYFLARQNSTF